MNPGDTTLREIKSPKITYRRKPFFIKLKIKRIFTGRYHNYVKKNKQGDEEHVFEMTVTSGWKGQEDGGMGLM